MRILAAAVLLAAAAWSAAQPVTLRLMGEALAIPPPEATDPRSLARRAVFDEFQRQNPDIRIANAGGLELSGSFAESSLLMSMAGDTAPDVFYVNFRQYFSYVEQGFCRPLDDFFEADPGLEGRVQPRIMDVLRSFDGRVYAVPYYQVAQALYYRRDHFLQAGLDPSRPPKTWDEFIEYGRKLNESAENRNGFAFSGGLGGKAYWWTNFVWQAGGEVLVPAERGYARSAVGTPEAATALDFFRRLTRETWQDAQGRTRGPLARITTNLGQDINEGRVSMWFGYTNDLVLSTSDIHPSLLGIAAMPAGPAGSVGEINSGMWAVNARLTDPRRLDAARRFITYFAGEEADAVATRLFVEQGMAALVNPVNLKRFGYPDLAASVDPAYVEANEMLFERGHPEPYGRNSQQVYLVLDSALDRALLEPNTPSLDILKDVEAEMNRQLLGYIPEAEMNRLRARAWILAGAVGLVSLWLVIRAWRRRPRRSESPGGRGLRGAWIFPALCILPASLSILVWSYYPLLQGLLIAFQDYRIVQPSQWVGLDNFIATFTQPIFWKSLWNSLVYVVLTLGIGFLLPVFLALAISEIPKGGTLFRVLFYLPAMTSPLIIALLWRWFYDPSPSGLLNSLVGPMMSLWNGVTGRADPTAFNWLGDPALAMPAVVLPGIWAGAGPGSILYLAALKTIPEERYEAADLDGADWRHKIRFITLPGLMPLMLINLLGGFIGGFKAMENVFVLTGGGPLYATHTIGLEVWTNAFLFLRFGYATAAAWVMGAILIGFTVLQLRHLMSLRFRTAS